MSQTVVGVPCVFPLPVPGAFTCDACLRSSSRQLIKAKFPRPDTLFSTVLFSFACCWLCFRPIVYVTSHLVVLNCQICIPVKSGLLASVSACQHACHFCLCFESTCIVSAYFLPSIVISDPSTSSFSPPHSKKNTNKKSSSSLQKNPTNSICHAQFLLHSQSLLFSISPN